MIFPGLNIVKKQGSFCTCRLKNLYKYECVAKGNPLQGRILPLLSSF